MKKISILLISLFSFATLGAQDFSFGFKAGLSFSTLGGDLETTSSGEDLEIFKLTRGFHFGPIFNLKLTDVFGLRAEVLYSQKGLDYTYDGQSYWVFYPTSGDDIYHSGGTRNTRLFISNGYLDIPITAVVRLGRIEVSAGVNAGILLSSKGLGEVTYSSTNIDAFTILLDYNFKTDEVNTAAGEDAQEIFVNGKNVLVPKNIGAYYGAFGRDKNLFNSLDLGLNAGLSFYLSKGLFLGFRLNYGLLDVTNDAQDISSMQLGENNTFINRKDVDKNISLQASVGFSF